MAQFVQNTFYQTPPAGRPGLLGDGWFGTDIETKFAPASGLIPGLAVKNVTGSANAVAYPTAGGDVAALASAGIVVADPALEQHDDQVLFAEGQAAPVIRKGRVFVVFEDPDNAVLHAQPFVRTTAGVGEQLGAFRSNADGGDATVCTWATVVSVDSLYGVVELDILLP